MSRDVPLSTLSLRVQDEVPRGQRGFHIREDASWHHELGARNPGWVVVPIPRNGHSALGIRAARNYGSEVLAGGSQDVAELRRVPRIVRES